MFGIILAAICGSITIQKNIINSLAPLCLLDFETGKIAVCINMDDVTLLIRLILLLLNARECVLLYIITQVYSTLRRFRQIKHKKSLNVFLLL